MSLTAVERRWVAALTHKQAGRLDKALAECDAAAKLAPPTAPQLAFRADIAASLGLTFRAARDTGRAAETMTELAPVAASRLFQASFFEGAERFGRRECRAFRAGKPQVEEPRFEVLPGLQLVAVVGALAGGRGFALDEEASRKFSQFKSHRAVRLYREAEEGGLRPVGAQRSMLEEGESSPLREALLEFGRKSKLAQFLQSRRRFFDETTARLEKEASRLRHAAAFARATGVVPRARYTVALSPFHADASARLHRLGKPGPDGRYPIVSTLAPPYDYAALAWPIWHELGHAATDHWLEGREASLDRSRPALTAASARRYGSWEQVVREHVVQGLATSLARKLSPAMPKDEEGPGSQALPYLDDVVGVFAKEPRLPAAYEKVLRLFERLAAKKRGAKEGRPARARKDGL